MMSELRPGNQSLEQFFYLKADYIDFIEHEPARDGMMLAIVIFLRNVTAFIGSVFLQETYRR